VLLPISTNFDYQSHRMPSTRATRNEAPTGYFYTQPFSPQVWHN
jgi:hypothetical protein